MLKLFKYIATNVTYKHILLAFIFSMISVSYTEHIQFRFFKPIINNLRFNSNEVITSQTLGLKRDRSGKVYTNPWHAIRGAIPIASQVAQFGCKNISSSDLDYILTRASYLNETKKIRSQGGHIFYVWPYNINFSYGVDQGWVSLMIQSTAALILFAASECFPELHSKTDAEQALNSLLVRVADGGVLVDLSQGVWFEEYADINVQPPLVLNGHIYALQSLWHLERFDSRVEGLKLKALTALRNNISKFDAVTWSFYDLYGTPANNFYQQDLHIRQMYEMYSLTEELVFNYYGNKFSMQKYSPFSSIQRFILKPSKVLGSFLVLNFFFYIIMRFVYLRFRGFFAK